MVAGPVLAEVLEYVCKWCLGHMDLEEVVAERYLHHC